MERIAWLSTRYRFIRWIALSSFQTTQARPSIPLVQCWWTRHSSNNFLSVLGCGNLTKYWETAQQLCAIPLVNLLHLKQNWHCKHQAQKQSHLILTRHHQYKPWQVLMTSDMRSVSLLWVGRHACKPFQLIYQPSYYCLLVQSRERKFGTG